MNALCNLETLVCVGESQNKKQSMNDTLLLRALEVTKFAHKTFTSALKKHYKNAL